MIISISGMPGSGKSAVAKILAKKLSYKHYSAGDFRREMANKRGFTIEQLNNLGEKEAFTDKEADDFQKELGEKEDCFVIDGRLSWKFIPRSIKFFLDADLESRAKRIMQGERKEERFASIDEAQKKIVERQESDTRRYLNYYGVDCYDKKHYDLVIDTTCITAERVAQKIIEFLKTRDQPK